MNEVVALSITLILIFMSFLFLRSNRYDYAIGTMPLIIYPAFTILISILGDIFNFNIPDSIRIIVDIGVIVISLIALYLSSKRFKARWKYFCVCGSFVVILGIIFLTKV